jgi:membrane protein implicated in regulation of membrane protease activity
MTDMFVSLGTWNWLIFGLILMALELLAPGVFLFWLGLAAFLVGVQVIADYGDDAKALAGARFLEAALKA